MDVRVREARPGDADAVRTVHRASILGLGTGAYSREQVEAWAAGAESADYAAIDDGAYHFVVAEVAGDGDADGNGSVGEGGDGIDDGRDDGIPGAGGVVAFGSLKLAAPEGYGAAVDAEVTGVYVHPDAAREGVGTAVIETLEARARAEGVERLGLTASANAVPFYEARGYDRGRERDHEFSAGEDTGVEGRVVEMVRPL
jgi:putative acetyltransferase